MSIEAAAQRSWWSNTWTRFRLPSPEIAPGREENDARRPAVRIQTQPIPLAESRGPLCVCSMMCTLQFKLRTCMTMVEINPLYSQIEDLQGRAEALRGYL